MFERYKVEPWFQLFAKRRMSEQKYQHEGLNNCMKVQRAIRQKRKECLGSDLGLTMFVHEDGKPLEKAVVALSCYLGSLTSHFLGKEYNYPDMEDICIGFFYYSLQLYAYDQIGCDSFDDLIQLAELFQCDIETFNNVLKNDLSEEIVNEWLEFLVENDAPVPYSFPQAVTGAISVFLGVLKDPTDNVA